LNEIPCATLLVLAVLVAKFLYLGRFRGAVWMPDCSPQVWLSLSRPLARAG
jgi:hypothetical protein